VNIVRADVDGLPRILIRTGTDGLSSSALARGVVDQTDANNWAVSADIVVSPEVVVMVDATQRRVYRHELGHALGYFGHGSEPGLMDEFGRFDELTDRERRMMVALYSLPAGVVVEADGTWHGGEGASGRLDDVQAAADVIQFNTHAISGASYRRGGSTCRWPTSIRVHVQQ
jgi:hypothetical protein